MPSLAAQAAGIRSLFLKPSSRLATSGKAVGCKVRLRLVFHTVRFLLSGSVLRCDSVLLAQYCIFSAHTPCAGGQGRETASSISPLALRHCGCRLAERNRSVFHSAPCNVGPGCSVQTLPYVTDCAKPARPAAATPCLLAPVADCMPRLTPRHTDSPGRQACIVAYMVVLHIMQCHLVHWPHIERIYSYCVHSVKTFDGMADFQ